MERFRGDIVMWGPHWDWVHYLPQQMAYEISKYVRVLYVNTPSITLKWFLPKRWGRLMSPRKELLDFAKHSLRRLHANLFVYTPPPLPVPYAHFHYIDDIFEHIHFSSVKRVVKKLDFTSPILWNLPFFLGNVDIKKLFAGALICYDCIGETRQWTQYRTKRDRLQYRENHFLKYVDLIITSAPTLRDKMSNIHKRVHYLPPGADVVHYSKALSAATLIPKDIATLTPPIIGYFGSMSNQKTDWAVMRFVAESRPDWSIALIGPVSEKPNVKLDDLENIHFLGKKPLSELPAYVKAFDVCIIPFPQDEFGRYAFPTKTFEYLATGKPVVSTDLPALREYHPLVRITKSKEEFLDGIEESLAEDDPTIAQRRIMISGEYTWQKRAEKILDAILQVWREI